LTSGEHDEVCAVVSHLPHLLANVYLEAFFAQRKDRASLGGSSFRDWMRIAGSCPEVWMDIFWTNRHNLIRGIHELQDVLEKITQFLENGDEQALYGFLTRVSRLKEDLQK